MTKSGKRPPCRLNSPIGSISYLSAKNRFPIYYICEKIKHKMNEKNIRSFSLATLLEANTLRPGDLYYDGCVIASRVDVTDEFNIGLFRLTSSLKNS